MIDRQGGAIVIECDACSETFETGADDFNEVWTAAKAEGWTTKQIGKDWVHFCPQCKELA